MRKETVFSLLKSFDHRASRENGVTVWAASELQNLLYCDDDEVFTEALKKARAICQQKGLDLSKHFITPDDGYDAGRLLLSRYACYLISNSFDAERDEISFAVLYFALQAQKHGQIFHNLEELERVRSREKLSISERRFSGVLHDIGIDELGIARIRSKGDEALFGGLDTAEIKAELKTPKNRPLADFLPLMIIKAKEFALSITRHHIDSFRMQTESEITAEHVKNNESVRRMLGDRKVIPENLPPEEDLEKAERRLKKIWQEFFEEEAIPSSD